MDDRPRIVLKDLIEKYGTSLVESPRRCEALLRDLCGERKREIFVLVSAIQERVPAELLDPSQLLPPQALYERLATRLQDNIALSPEASRWAVSTWSSALGLEMPAWRSPQINAPHADRPEKHSHTTAAPPSDTENPGQPKQARKRSTERRSLLAVGFFATIAIAALWFVLSKTPHPGSEPVPRTAQSNTATNNTSSTTPEGMYSQPADATLPMSDAAPDTLQVCSGCYVYDAVFTEDGEKLITSSSDHYIRVWEVTRKTEIYRSSTTGARVAYDAKSNRLAWCSEGATATILTVGSTGGPSITLENGDRLEWLAISPDGSQLAWTKANATVHVADRETGKLQWKGAGTNNWNYFIGFSPDGRDIATGGSVLNRTTAGREIGPSTPNLDIFNAHSGEHIRTLECLRNDKALIQGDDSVAKALFADDSNSVLTVTTRGVIQLWNVETGVEIRRLLTDGYGESFAFNPQANLMAYIRVGNVMEVVLSRMTDGQEQQTWQIAEDHRPRMSFAPHGPILAVPSGSQVILFKYRQSTATGDETVVWKYSGAPGDQSSAKGASVATPESRPDVAVPKRDSLSGSRNADAAGEDERVRQWQNKLNAAERMLAERDLWQALQRNPTILGLQGYLRRYPEGTYVSNARQQLLALKTAVDERVKSALQRGPGRTFVQQLGLLIRDLTPEELIRIRESKQTPWDPYWHGGIGIMGVDRNRIPCGFNVTTGDILVWFGRAHESSVRHHYAATAPRSTLVSVTDLVDRINSMGEPRLANPVTMYWTVLRPDQSPVVPDCYAGREWKPCRYFVQEGALVWSPDAIEPGIHGCEQRGGARR